MQKALPLQLVSTFLFFSTANLDELTKVVSVFFFCTVILGACGQYQVYLHDIPNGYVFVLKFGKLEHDMSCALTVNITREFK